MEHVPASLYRELGVEPGVSPQKLRQAYRKSVMRYHPDTAVGGGNTEKFRQVTEAYNLLQKMTSEMHRSSKTTTSKTYSLKRKFTSVFQKKKINNSYKFKKWSEKSSNWKSDNQKIKVNQQTSNLSLRELINCVELSENEYVRQVAMEAIATRREENGIDYLLSLLSKKDFLYRSHLISTLGISEFHQISNYLFPFVLDSSIEIAASAIKSLEKIDLNNRAPIIEILIKNTSDSKNLILRNIHIIKNSLFSVNSSKYLLGKILLRSEKITKDQLEIALLIQKRFPILLGQILRYLEYVSIPDIKIFIASQKKLR